MYTWCLVCMVCVSVSVAGWYGRELRGRGTTSWGWQTLVVFAAVDQMSYNLSGACQPPGIADNGANYMLFLPPHVYEVMYLILGALQHSPLLCLGKCLASAWWCLASAWWCFASVWWCHPASACWCRLASAGV